MPIHEIPVVPGYLTGSDQAADHPAGAAPTAADGTPHLHCAAGWVVEMQNLVERVPSPAVLGASIFSGQDCLHAAVAEAQQRHAALLEAGFFDLEADHVEVQVMPQPLGPVTDPDGNPVELDEEH